MSQQTNSIQINEKEDEIEIDIVELLFFYRSRILIILAGLVLGVVFAGLCTKFLITPKYTAMAKLYMVSASKDSIVDLTDLDIGASLSNDYEELLKVRPIFEQVIEQEKLDYTYEELLSMVSVSTIGDTRILTITVESTKPKEAQAVANALADKAVSELPKLMDTSEPNIAERAIYPKSQSSPSMVKNVVIGGLVGALLVAAVLTFFFMTDDTLKSAEDVEKAIGVMPLTVIPEGDVESISEKKEKEVMKQKKKRKKKDKTGGKA